MIRSKAKYIFGTAFDAIVILVIAALSIFIYQSAQEVDHKKNELLKCVSGEDLKIAMADQKNSRFASLLNSAPSSEKWNAVKTKAHEFELATKTLAGLAVGAMILAVTLVTGYKTQEYVFFNKPKKELVTKLAKNLALHDSASEGENIEKKPLKELVEILLTARTESETFINEITKGNLDYQATFTTVDKSAGALLSMQQKLREVSTDEKKILWINENLSLLETVIKNNAEDPDIYSKVITFIARKMSASVGAIYSYHNRKIEPYFEIIGSYGFYNNTRTPKTIPAGEGQLGQLAFEPSTVQLINVPSEYLTIHSGLGSSAATHVVIVPLLFKERLYGAFELASFTEPLPFQIQWLEKSAESIGAYLFNKNITAESKTQLEKLAEQQASELVQIHALQQETNERLQIQLKEAHDERLKNQAILEGCVDGVICFDQLGKISFCNNSLLEMLCCSREALTAKNLFEILPIEMKVSDGKIRPYYVAGSSQKEVQVRTEAGLISTAGDMIDVLITSTEVSVNEDVFFTFFIQKISVDLF